MSMSNVDRVPYKCPWKCRNISIYHGKKAQKNQNHMFTQEKCSIICWNIYIHIYIHTHTLTNRLILQAFHEKKCQKLGTDSKKCLCHFFWKDLQMSNICRCRWILQMSTRYGWHRCSPLTEILAHHALLAAPTALSLRLLRFIPVLLRTSSNVPCTASRSRNMYREFPVLESLHTANPPWIFKRQTNGAQNKVFFALFLLNRYWGIVTVPGSFLESRDLGWPDPHPPP